MAKESRYISLILAVIVLVFAFVSCSGNKQPESLSDEILGKNVSYIIVNGNELPVDYIGYFFYVAQRNMIQEAGMVLGEGGNSTKEDVDEFWKTTEIEGRKAVDVARDLAADNAVIQTVQYLKAIEEGITLSAEDEKTVETQIENAKQSNGGEEAFKKTLSEMGCSQEAYKQILTENMFVNKLYQKYDSEGKLDISREELDLYSKNYGEDIAPEVILESAKKDKFNVMSQEWKKNYDIVIHDDNMKNFNVK